MDSGREPRHAMTAPSESGHFPEHATARVYESPSSPAGHSSASTQTLEIADMRAEVLNVLTAVCFVARGHSEANARSVNTYYGQDVGTVPDQVASPSGGAYNYQVVLPAPGANFGLLMGRTNAVSGAVPSTPVAVDNPARQPDSSTVYGTPAQGILPLGPATMTNPSPGYVNQNYGTAERSPAIFPPSDSGAPVNQQPSITASHLGNSNIRQMYSLANLLNLQPSSGGNQIVSEESGVRNFNGQNKLVVVQPVQNQAYSITPSEANKQSGSSDGQFAIMVNGPSSGMNQQHGTTYLDSRPSAGQTGQTGHDQKASGTDQAASGSGGFTMDDFTPPEPQHLKVFDDGDKYIDDDKDQPEPEVILLRLQVPQPVPVAVPYKVAVPVPHPYPVPVHIVERYEVPVEKVVEELVEKKVPVLVETIVPYPVIKHLPVQVEKLVPVPQPYPYPVPVHVVKYVHHYSKKSGGEKGKNR